MVTKWAERGDPDFSSVREELFASGGGKGVIKQENSPKRPQSNYVKMHIFETYFSRFLILHIH